MAHLDSHRAVFWFATDFIVRIFVPISITATFRDFPGDSQSISLAALTHWQVLGWLGLFLAFFHFLGWFTGVTADLGRYSPGANDNAASVGTVLGLAERLAGQPLQNTEVWLAFTGCEETNAGGTLALIEEHGSELKEALFVDFEMVGIGDRISYVREEGNISRLTIPQEVETLVKAGRAALWTSPGPDASGWGVHRMQHPAEAWLQGGVFYRPHPGVHRHA